MTRLLIGTTLMLVVGGALPAAAQQHARQIGSIKCGNNYVERNEGFNLAVSGCGVSGLEMSAVMLELDPGWYVKSDNPSCGDRYGADLLKLAARAIAAYFSSGASEAPGETSFESIFGKVDEYLSRQGGALAEAWRESHNIQDRSRCQLIQVHVPVPPQQIQLITAVMHESNNIRGFDNTCFQTRVMGGVPQQTSAKCPIDWAAVEHLAIEPSGTGSVVVAMAKNWSADRKRSPALHVWYGATGTSARPGGLPPGTMGPGTIGPPPKEPKPVSPPPVPPAKEATRPKDEEDTRPKTEPPTFIVLPPVAPAPKTTPPPPPSASVAPRDAGLIRLHNPCAESVKVALTIQNLDGTWQTLSWYNVEPEEETAPISANGTIVRTRNGNFYFYAESETLTWRGDPENPEDRTYVIDEVPLRFRHESVTADHEGSYKLKLICGK